MTRPLATLSGLVLAALVSTAAPALDDKSIPSNEKHPIDTTIPAGKGKLIDLAVGKEKAIAYVARPAAAPKGAILVIHEWWGLNDGVKHESDRLAELGYLVLAIDLYKGVVAKTPDEAGAAMKALDGTWASAVEVAGIKWLKAESKGKKVATLGWCFGGGQSLKASLADPQDVSATVIYYGMPTLEVAQLKTLKGPVLGNWANKDGWITPEVVAKFAAAMKEAGVAYDGKGYDADHAFANPTGGKHNPEAAKDAWVRTTAFLAQALK